MEKENEEKKKLNGKEKLKQFEDSKRERKSVEMRTIKFGKVIKDFRHNKTLLQVGDVIIYSSRQ